MILTFVYLELPPVDQHVCYRTYARVCIEHCIGLRETPAITRAIETSAVLDDVMLKSLKQIEENLRGQHIRPERTIVYADFGILPSMADGISAGEKEGRLTTYRHLPSHVLMEIKVKHPPPELPPSHPFSAAS